nr:DUF475 domain-containing protein [uncultured Gellertiella sp.]
MIKTSKSFLSYFRWAFALTAIGLVLGAVLGYSLHGTFGGAFTALFICAVLGVLEISLSFDNAIVNARKLQEMTPAWQRRFLTWGIIIAVFGMRIIFPLLIVAVAARISPWAALDIALFKPVQYAGIMEASHLSISAFGGTFLMMVGLTYFFDSEKDVHWISALEKKMVRTSVKGIEVAIVLITVLVFTCILPREQSVTFLFAAVWGLVTFLLVEVIGELLDASQEAMSAAARGGLGAFIYLEVLDASFSFDGVIGAFALSHNLFIIAIGLGIGAMYVRSLTIMLVEKGTLAEYRYLEHGAFYAIIVLALIMFLQTIMDVPEVVTGLAGASLIFVSLRASIRYNRQHPEPRPPRGSGRHF